MSVFNRHKDTLISVHEKETIVLVVTKSDLELRISSSIKIIVHLKMIHQLPLDFLFFSSLFFEAYNQIQ